MPSGAANPRRNGKAMRVYIVVYKTAECGSTINQDAFSTFEKATEFIKKHSRNAKKIAPFKYEQDDAEWLIHDLIVE